MTLNNLILRVFFWFCGYKDSVGIPTGFSVGMGWVWGLQPNSHGSPIVNTHLELDLSVLLVQLVH